MTRRLVVAAVVAVVSGCVSQETYDKLEADQRRTLDDLNRSKSELDKSRADLKALEARAADLASKLAQLEAAYGKSQTDKSALEGALAELRKRKEETEARVAEFKALLAKFKSLIDAGKLKVRIREGRMVVELATDILFPSGSASLSKEGKAAIAEVAGLLQSIPERKFQIEGHTDDVPVAKASYKSNWELASARALTVLHTMREAGMPANRISAASYGDAMPARANDSPENKAANRRIEIVLVPDLSSLPGFDELQKASQ